MKGRTFGGMRDDRTVYGVECGIQIPQWKRDFFILTGGIRDGFNIDEGMWADKKKFVGYRRLCREVNSNKAGSR